MIEAESSNVLANTWPSLTAEHHAVPVWLRALMRVLGKGLSAAMPFMAGLCPLYVVLDLVFRDFHPPLDPVSCLALAGIGACFVYLPFYLSSPPEQHLWMTTALLIGFGFVAGLVGVLVST